MCFINIQRLSNSFSSMNSKLNVCQCNNPQQTSNVTLFKCCNVTMFKCYSYIWTCVSVWFQYCKHVWGLWKSQTAFAAPCQTDFSVHVRTRCLFLFSFSFFLPFSHLSELQERCVLCAGIPLNIPETSRLCLELWSSCKALKLDTSMKSCIRASAL